MQRALRTLLVVVAVSATAAAGTAAGAVLQVGPRTREPVVVRVDEGFHWLDAAIGAAAALGLALLVLGFVLTSNRAKGER
jgi:hypothetical protein